MSLAREFSRLYEFREVLRNLVSSDLKLRFRRSFLGYGWSLLYPLLMMLILAVVFSKVSKFASPAEMIPYLFAGLIPWNFFVATCMAGSSSLLTNEALLKKIYLPKIIFPLAILLARFVDFLFNVLALFVVVAFISFKPSLALLTLPFAIVILFLFVSGVTIALSAINVYVRDAAHLMSVLIQLGFFGTPIIYREQDLDAKYRALLEINPFTHIVRVFHVIISDGQIPDAQTWGMAALMGVGAFVFGSWIFTRLERNLIFRL